MTTTIPITPVATPSKPAPAAAAQAAKPLRVGDEAVRDKGWWLAYRFLLLRRTSQVGILALFLLGPWAGVWWVKGNLSSSMTFGVLPLSDPFLLLQVIASRIVHGHLPEATALIGGAIVVAFYALAGGRVFCSWACPVNMVTDSASWLRRRFNITSGKAMKRELRFWLAGAILIACAVTGMAVWEWVNPVSMLHRALIFGGTTAWFVVLGVFLFDLLVAPRGWCGHVCPMGATYHAIGAKSLLKVSARHSSACNDCADCYAICPEPHIIPGPLKGKQGQGPLIDSSACTNCGRCIDVCSKSVFTFTHRFDTRRD